ncbi:prop effector [Ralstonia sp. A12]|uniref:ProQ/FinO family protein n=1 Tax=Ralstonia sp. A12 TaxID=1217052 RepID=UPI000575AF16|nr:ProQ/FinO family protein [Ralstonia sp. A12]KHK49009.1 prop effector [Ralstonia sp. A12]
MGFEELAALKAELAEQAKRATQAKAAQDRRAPATQGKPPVDAVVRIIGKLQKHFPVAFPKNPAPKVPLKIGIFDDLLTHATALEVTEAELRDALRTWCRGARYWACLTDGAQRLDLTGQGVGQVTQAEAYRGQQLRAGRSQPDAARSKMASQPEQPPRA